MNFGSTPKLETVFDLASDHSSGVHPDVMAAIQDANRGMALAYGLDPWTEHARALFQKKFGKSSEVFFVYNGTGANILSLSAMVQSYHAVLCSEVAHILEDECGAPEKQLGVKLISVPHQSGKIIFDALESRVRGLGSQHHSQIRALSITQTTEFGQVYTLDETRALVDWAHKRGFYVHMDGARISNAAAALGCEIEECSSQLGIDVLSFGGTKNGLLGAEAVVVLRPELAQDLMFRRKQLLQLGSKLRFQSAQWIAFFENDLWKKNAQHANAMAKRLHDGLSGVRGVEWVHPVQANALFVKLPAESIADLQKLAHFWVWDESKGIARWMTSCETRPEQIDAFVQGARGVLERGFTSSMEKVLDEHSELLKKLV